MMRTIVRRAMLAGAGLTAAAILVACGSNSGGHGSMPGMATSAGTKSSPAMFSGADVMFAQMMIPHHRQAVDMAVLAETRAADSELQRLATQIKAAQDPEIQTMIGWLTTWGDPVPSASGGTETGGMNHGVSGMMSDADMGKLKAAAGRDFDKQFCTMMIAHHQGPSRWPRTSSPTAPTPTRGGSLSRSSPVSRQRSTQRTRSWTVCRRALAVRPATMVRGVRSPRLSDSSATRRRMSGLDAQSVVAFSAGVGARRFVVQRSSMRPNFQTANATSQTSTKTATMP